MNRKETEEVTSGDQQGTALQTHQHSRRNVKLNSAYIWFVVNNPKSIYISLRNYSIPYIFENVGGEEQSSCYLLRILDLGFHCGCQRIFPEKEEVLQYFYFLYL